MKQINALSKIVSIVAFAVLTLAAFSSVGWAGQGTPAGTAITNQAIVTFNSGTSVGRTQPSNTTTVWVAVENVIQLTPTTSAGNSVDGTTIYRSFQIKNDGNYADTYTLSAPTVPAGWTVAIYHDLGTVNTFDGADVISGSTGVMAVDAVYNVIVAITIPHSNTQAVDGTTYPTNIRVASTNVDALGSNIFVSNKNFYVEHVASVKIVKPNVTMVATAVEPASKIPGALFTFSLAVQNTGTGPVSGVSTITYTLPPEFQYVSSSWLPAPVYTASGTGYGGTLVMTLTAAQLVATSSVNTIPLTVRIQQTQNSSTGTPSGTSITSAPTDFSLGYSDGSVTPKTQAPTSSAGYGGAFTVAAASGLTYTMVSATTMTGDPGTTFEYHMLLKNTGNHTDQFDFTDAKNGGILNVTPVMQLTSGAGTAVTFVAGMAAGATQDVYARVTIPLTAADLDNNIRNLTAATHTGSAVPPTSGVTTVTVTVTTNVTAPKLVVTILPPTLKSGTGTATYPAPGDIIEYTVTIFNNGSGNATLLSTSNSGVFGTGGTNVLDGTGVDLDPANDGFASLNQTAGQTATEGAVSMTVGAYNAATGTITITIPTLLPTKTVSYRYRVLIK
jgi:hypothetical protein